MRENEMYMFSINRFIDAHARKGREEGKGFASRDASDVKGGIVFLRTPSPIDVVCNSRTVCQRLVCIKKHFKTRTTQVSSGYLSVAFHLGTLCPRKSSPPKAPTA